MSSSFGRLFRVTTFGESHGPAIGVTVDGAPSGLRVTAEDIQLELDRRRPGANALVSARKEPDKVEILSGITKDKTLGSPIAMIIYNRNARSRDYSQLAALFRPSHADFTYFKKYGIPPQPGGGRASGRETAARVAGGAIAKLLLKPLGISIRAFTVQIGKVVARKNDSAFAESNPLRCADPDAVNAMTDEVLDAKNSGDSIGGIVELEVVGVPPGLGEPVFQKIDAILGGALLSIGAVKGVEFGAGFNVALRRGSENNDQISDDGFNSNHAGGILGGITTGQPIVIRLAVKPPASIAIPQTTINLDGETQSIKVEGRHDPCLCPRICPVAEAMTALVLADAWMEQAARKGRI